MPLRRTRARSMRARTAGVAAGVLLAATLGLSCLARAEVPFPEGTDFGESSPLEPRERFHSNLVGTGPSYLVKLGDVAFSSPSLFGPMAQQAGLSCESCHSSGASNPRFYIPGHSGKPGTFNPTGGLFNPDAANGAHDAVRIPSLRGARSLAPYGHDGRSPSLRDFIHDVITREFGGPEPSPKILDALVAYVQDIDFLPNPRLAPGGGLATGANEAERRGEALFNRPFPGDPTLSCATCHVPSSGFTDHRVHDVGTGGLERTPTLLNASANAPYFHDGRFDTLTEALGHFDRFYRLGLSAQERDDLRAYLDAVTDAPRAFERRGVDDELSEIARFESVLDTAVSRDDVPTVRMTADVIGSELREMVEVFPPRANRAVTAGLAERTAARGALKGLVITMRDLSDAASAGDTVRMQAALARYHADRAASETALEDAEPYSLYVAENQAATRAMLQAAGARTTSLP
jgi:cytochrome c peroxidase